MNLLREAEVAGLLLVAHQTGLGRVRYLQPSTAFVLLLHPAWMGRYSEDAGAGVFAIRYGLASPFVVWEVNGSICPLTDGR